MLETRVAELIETYQDALDRVEPEDFVTLEAFHAVKSVWQEVVTDCERLLQ